MPNQTKVLILYFLFVLLPFDKKYDDAKRIIKDELAKRNIEIGKIIADNFKARQANGIEIQKAQNTIDKYQYMLHTNIEDNEQYFEHEILDKIKAALNYQTGYNMINAFLVNEHNELVEERKIIIFILKKRGYKI